jgi:preprotein translocase subunit SecA
MPAAAGFLRTSLADATGGSVDHVRNAIGWRERLAGFRGVPIEFDLQSYDGELAAIQSLEPELAGLSDEELDRRARQLRDRARNGAGSDAQRVEFFALGRELSRRVLGLRPFDEQIVAALALDRGAIVEMQTGEGKTLAAVMPAALNALSGQGVHVLTFNDYLARRDAEWMGQVYRRLGLSVGFVQQGMNAESRRQAYLADVTYVTAKEAGFDHLRDLLAMDTNELVHRPFHVALVDEADSLLIDEARVPLVIAGRTDTLASSSQQMAEIVSALEPGVHFDTDEYARDVALTEAGIEHVERTLKCGKLHDERNYQLLTELSCALHARALLRRDVDYLVRDGHIGIIDELTGRVVPDRHWPDGLQAALEAKEGLQRQADGRILGSITLQHFLQRYPKLSGMTGTAQPAAMELRELYGLRTVVIPPHRPVIRVDQPDEVFTHRETKENAVVREVVQAHATGRPVLVGTLTVEESERIAEALRARGIACEVLNAKNDAAEARTVAAAGQPGAVTISTNMAGRGTDIRLGGADERQRATVVALGGLSVIGTNRHESRRIDLQLQGRAGRQGDPGETRFFISLEDDLLVRYGIERLIAGRFVSTRRDDPIDHPVVLQEISRAQRIVEGQTFEIRKTLWRYASAVEQQRRILMTRRQSILTGASMPDVWQGSDRWSALVASVGEDTARRAERSVTLLEIDRAWREHLALVADLREGIHLVSLGGHDPLARFSTEIAQAFQRLEDSVDDAILQALDRLEIKNGHVDLEALQMKGPSATWTYLVNDDPFKNQIGMLLTGPGRVTFAIGAAIASMPLLIVWGLVDRWKRKPRAVVREKGKGKREKEKGKREN